MIGIKESDITEPRCHISSPQSDVLTDELMDDRDHHDPEVTSRTNTSLCVFVHCVCVLTEVPILSVFQISLSFHA